MAWYWIIFITITIYNIIGIIISTINENAVLYWCVGYVYWVLYVICYPIRAIHNYNSSYSGMLWWINTILHTFGWAITVEIDTETGVVTNCYPARVKFRGFGEKQIVEGYQKVSQYILNNAQTLYDESCE